MPPPGQAQRAASKFIVFEQFEKMNTQSVRQALSEKELAWLENLQPIAGNNLTTVPAPNAALTSISETITAQYFANLGTVDYIISFTSVGSGWATNIATAASVRFAPPGTFSNPDMTVWESQYVLFNDPTAGYSAWAGGTVFSKQGGVSPLLDLTSGGSGYTSAPTVTISGGSGSGATVTATVSSPGVGSVAVITGGAGYGPAPTVVFSGGGGTGAAATANIDPRGVNTITLTFGGTTYSSVPTVTLVGGGGTGATATATIGGGAVTSVTITNPGANYTSQPAVQFTGGGSTFPATANATIGNGQLLSVTVTSSGGGYTSAPTVTFTGGGFGSGASAAASLGGGEFVNGLTLTNPGAGYLASDILTVTFTGGIPSQAISSWTYVSTSGLVTLTLAATVIFGPGATITVSGIPPVGAGTIDGTFTAISASGTTATYTAATGLGNSSGTGGTVTAGMPATATAHVWPFTEAGTTLAIFQGRVWLGGGRLLQYTGTAGFDDFDPANASGSLDISDADLVHAITALRNYNNYLFIMGDQSVKQIGNISLNAAGNVTLFTILTLSSDQGTIYPRSCGSFNRVFFFCNSNGVYAVFGSSVQKISDDMDGIFKLIDFTQQPQSAIADMNNIHNICWLVRYIDPLSTTRSILLTFTGKKWFVVSQGNSLAAITTASTLASGKNMTFASSGQDITQILGNYSGPVSFTLRTSLTHHGNAVQRKKLLAAGTALTTAGAGNITVNFDTENGTVPLSYALGSGFQLPGGHSGVGGSGRYLGLTVAGTLANFTFTNGAQEYDETSLWT